MMWNGIKKKMYSQQICRKRKNKMKKKNIERKRKKTNKNNMKKRKKFRRIHADCRSIDKVRISISISKLSYIESHTLLNLVTL